MMRLPAFFLVLLSLALLGGCSQAVKRAPDAHPAGDLAPAQVSEALSSDRQAGHTEADRLAAQAVDHLLKGKLDKASRKINAALRLQTDRSYFHLVNAIIYHLKTRAGRDASYEVADQGYELALRFDPTNHHAQYFRGLLAIDRGQFEQATQYLAEALTYRHDDAEILRSLAYAAYRAGKPDVAAGAIDALSAQGQLTTPADRRNAAMIMAAVGEDGRARDFLAQLRATGQGTTRQADEVERRLADWRQAYLRAGAQRAAAQPLKVAAEAAPPAAAEGQASALPVLSPDRMVVVDVVIIATQENINTARGVNLLNGLQMQFGLDGNGYGVPAMQQGRIESWTEAAGTQVSRTFTRSLGIPSINYSMNIFNANNQLNEILARPTLVARAGHRSEFFSGIELNAVAVSSGAAGGAPVQLQRQIGVYLGITPTFLDDGRISLDILAERTFLKTPSKDVAFTFRVETTKSNVNASVVMRYGETLILGGLSEKESENGRDGVPFLQDIPGLQYLFSRNTTLDFQKSVLVLITPRPAEYVYQPDNARAEYERSLSDEERSLASLRSRYGDWFKPYPNWASVFHHLQGNSLYREFRTGDVALESWTNMRSLGDRLRSIGDFLYY